MNNTISKIISVAFHPLLMTTWFFMGIIIFHPIFLEPISRQNMYFFLLLVFITTFIIPVISISIFKFSGVVSSLTMPTREERFLPLLFITIIYGLSLYLMYKKLAIGINVVAVFLGIDILLLFLTFISLKWQISLHAAASSGLVGFALAMLFNYPEQSILFYCIILILLSGIISSARLHQNAHTIEEVGAGSFLGFITCFVIMYLMA